MKVRFVLNHFRQASNFGLSGHGLFGAQLKRAILSMLIAAVSFFVFTFVSVASQLNVPTYSDANGRYTISWDMQGLSSPSRLEEFSGSGWKLISTSRSGSKSFDKASDGTVIYRLMECDNEVGCIIEDKRDSVSVQHTPGVPSLTIESFTDPDGAYTVTWAKPGGTVKSYQLLENNSVVYNGPNRNFSLSSKADGSYDYTVKACNDVSCSSASGSKTVTVLKVPTAPQNLTASEAVVKDGTLRLTWDASQETVGHYTVVDTTTNVVLKEISELQADFVNELDNGSHSFAVKACNDTGCSAVSDPVTVSVEMPPQVPTSFVVPSESRSGRFSVTWKTTDMLAVATYSEVHRGLNGAELEFYQTVNAPAEDQIIWRINEHFVEDGTSAYKVKACNEFGCSDFTETKSVEISLVTSEVIPDGPVVNLPVPSNDQPAALTGKGGVSGGKATYSIPLPIPPGRKGMQPELSLDYSSSTGESRTGLGWSVNSGSGSIYRCSRIEAVDGENRPYEQRIDDRLCMDGHTLMLDSGVYGQIGSVYFTEIDNFSRVTLVAGSSLMDTSVFKVERKDGTIVLYGDIHGNSIDKPAGAQAPFTWYPSKVIDRSGNNIKYVYSSETIDKKLSRILYTGLKNSSGNREIQFNYTVTDDHRISYRQGASIISSSQLADIEFKVDGMFSHKVALGYDENSKGQALLASLEYCADEACQNTTKPTLFAYDNHEFDFEKATLSTNKTLRYSVTNDYDGDGTRELKRLTYLDQIPPGAPIKNELKMSSTGQWIDITDEFSNGYGSSEGFYPMGRASDLTRDGKADVLGHENGYFQVGSFDGTGFTKIPSSLAMDSSGPYIREVKDFNRDGHLDLFLRETSDTYRIRFRCPDTANDSINFCGETEINLQWNVTVKESIDSIEDFNGDGLPDLFVVDTVRKVIDPERDLTKILYGRQDSSGKLHFDEWTLEDLGAPPEFGEDPLHQRLDVNGDGLTDLVVYTWRDGGTDTIELYLNRGIKAANNFTFYSFSSPVNGLDNSLVEGMKVLDYNNDGKQELMFPGAVVNHFCYEPPNEEPDPDNPDAPGNLYCTNATGVGDILRSSRHESKNKAIYQWNAVGFVFNGDWSVTKQTTDLELPINLPTPEVDFNGDGNNDYIYKLKQTYSGSAPTYATQNKWFGDGATADVTYVVINREKTTGGFSHSNLTHVYGETVLEHNWDYSSLSGEGSPGCSYGADSLFTVSIETLETLLRITIILIHP